MNLGDGYQDAVLNAIYGGYGASFPGTIYVALYTAAPTNAGGGTEVTTSGTAYARVALANDSTTWPGASGGDTQPGVAAVFPTATADWGTIVAYAFHDDPTADSIVTWGDLTSPVIVDNTDTPAFASGAITISASYGPMTSIAVGNSPIQLALNADGSRLYVANSGDGTLSVIDTGTDMVTNTVALASTTPVSVAVNPANGQIWVGATGMTAVYILDPTLLTVIGVVTGVSFTYPEDIAFRPDGLFAVIADGGLFYGPGGGVVEVDATTYAYVTSYASGGLPYAQFVSYSSDGTKVYCLSALSQFITILIGTGVVADFYVPIQYNGFVAMTPDGRYLWGVPVATSNDILLVDIIGETHQLLPSGLSHPWACAIGPDGTVGYTNERYSPTVIATLNSPTPSFVTSSVPTDRLAVANIVVSPDGTLVYSGYTDGDSNGYVIVTPGGFPALTDLAGTGSVDVNSADAVLLANLTLLDAESAAIAVDASPAPLIPDLTFLAGGSSDVDVDGVTASMIADVELLGTATGQVDVDGVAADLALISIVALEGTGHVDVDGAGATLTIPLDLEGTSHIDIDGSSAVLTGGTVLTPLVGVGSIDIDSTRAVLTGGETDHEASVTCFVLAGDPPSTGFAVLYTPTPPNPLPGPFGNHEYEVVVCDRYGIALGVIPSAVPTQIDWELDGIGQALIDVWIKDPLALWMLPMSVLPGVREIQIWRDQELIWWGWPISATWDNVQVHLTCSGLLWPLSRREFGPPVIRLLLNPQFEQGLDNWSAVDCFAAVTTSTVYLGKQAAQLLQLTPGADSYLHATVSVDLTDSVTGFAFALAAYYYIDTTYTFSGPALNQRGLYWEDNFGNSGFFAIDNSGPFNSWTRAELEADPALIAFAGEVTTFDIRLYCPGGSIVWDDVQLVVYENISAEPPSPPATSWDVRDICLAILTSAQEATDGKSDLALEFYGAPTGVLLNRVYEVSDNEVILDALNEFPTIGVIDFEIIWDATGHFRGFQVFSPAKGSIKWNAVIDIDFNETTTCAGQVDGTQVGTTQRVLGQGSSGPAQDLGYAGFASYLGGRVVTDGVTIIGFAGVSSATADFTDDDLGLCIYSLDGSLSPGTVITEIVSTTAVLTNNVALLTLADQTVGIDGITLDTSSSAFQNQPVSTLQASAESLLIQQMTALPLPTPRMRADGPNGLFGLITVGDVVPVSANYGWVQIPPTLMRIAQLTLYPPTEELEPTLMPLNQLASPS